MSSATLPHNGTATSLAAARSISPRRKDADERRILAFIRTQPAGATCDEVELALGLSHQTASARLNGLANAKPSPRVIACGTRPTRTGRMAGVYILGAGER